MAPELEATPALPFDLAAPYGLRMTEKRLLLLSTLNSLTEWHTTRCVPYARVRERMFAPGPAASIEGVPYLPVRLFKTHDLASVPREQVVRTMASSGTTSDAVSRIHLDRETAMRQSRVLAAIMATFIGRQRLPMAIIDNGDALKDRSRFNARSAAILGFSVLGRDHFHALDASMQLDAEGLQSFLDAHADEPVLVFGFTFLVWQALVRPLARDARQWRFPPGSTLVHGGGWKRLAEQSVGNDAFKQAVRESTGIERVFNYYGMVEQVGSIFMECEHGHLHAPVFADVVVRDPLTLAPLQAGHEGVLQVLSALPLSYPGHSLLTEDLGRLHGEDDCPCGRAGRHFSVAGRMPQAELRGCSDTRPLP